MAVSVITTDLAPRSGSPLSQAVKLGSLVFVSGQLGIDPATKTVVGGGVRAETKQALENLRVILEAAGSSLQDVVKTTCFLTDIADFAAFNEVYATYFPENQPARSTFQVTALAGDFAVEIEAIGAVNGDQ